MHKSVFCKWRARDGWTGSYSSIAKQIQFEKPHHNLSEWRQSSFIFCFFNIISLQIPLMWKQTSTFKFRLKTSICKQVFRRKGSVWWKHGYGPRGQQFKSVFANFVLKWRKERRKEEVGLSRWISQWACHRPVRQKTVGSMLLTLSLQLAKHKDECARRNRPGVKVLVAEWGCSQQWVVNDALPGLKPHRDNKALFCLKFTEMVVLSQIIIAWMHEWMRPF